jgi:hypothetical protein
LSALFEPADGMAFHVVGEQGILFVERSQDLLLLDPAASYIWCSVRDGMSYSQIVSDYAEACELSRPKAERIVGGLLHRWLGLGYIRGQNIPSPPPVEFQTALARLLVNPALRGAFAIDPHGAARDLALREQDIPLFVRMAPAEVEALAGSLAPQTNDDRRRPSTADAGLISSAVRRYQTRPWNSPTRERFYRLGRSKFRIAFDTAEQETVVHGAFRHLETAATRCDFSFDVIAEKTGHIILKDGLPLDFCDRLDRLARAALFSMIDAVIEHEEFFLLIHAGLVSNGNACALLPAASGSGKSTLTAALARAGFRFFTDEIAMLDEGTMTARPFPLPVVVKAGSIEPLRPWYPELLNLPVSLRDNDQRVRYLPLPISSLPQDGCCRQPVRWIVFPRYDAAVDTAMHPLRPEAALARLLQECRIVRTQLDQNNVAGLMDWFRNVTCYELSLSSLPEAVRLMQELCGIARPT